MQLLLYERLFETAEVASQYQDNIIYTRMQLPDQVAMQSTLLHPTLLLTERHHLVQEVVPLDVFVILWMATRS